MSLEPENHLDGSAGPEISAREMCREMVVEDLKTAQSHALLRQHGHNIAVARQH